MLAEIVIMKHDQHENTMQVLGLCIGSSDTDCQPVCALWLARAWPGQLNKLKLSESAGQGGLHKRCWLDPTNPCASSACAFSPRTGVKQSSPRHATSGLLHGSDHAVGASRDSTRRSRHSSRPRSLFLVEKFVLKLPENHRKHR